MSAAEYDRYKSTMEQSARATGRGLYATFDPRDPNKQNPKTTIMVATGGTRESRTKFELGPERIKRKPEGAYKPKGALPGGKTDRAKPYGGTYKGTSPTDYSKPRGKRP
jgi:hypothetical protein